AARQKQAHDVCVSFVGGPMQACLSALRVELRSRLHASLQEKLDDARSAEFTCPSEPGLHLCLGRWRFQAAVVVKEGFPDIEPADSSGSFQAQPGAATSQELCRLPAPVMQAAIDPATSIRAVDERTMLDQ